MRAPLSLEILVASFALLALLGAQLMLSAAIQGTNYYGVDGKMAQAVILTVFEFGDRFGPTASTRSKASDPNCFR